MNSMGLRGLEEEGCGRSWEQVGVGGLGREGV